MQPREKSVNSCRIPFCWVKPNSKAEGSIVMPMNCNTLPRFMAARSHALLRKDRTALEIQRESGCSFAGRQGAV